MRINAEHTWQSKVSRLKRLRMQGIVNLHPAKPDVLFSRGENMIYKSQEPLRILGDLSDDVKLTVINEHPDDLKSFENMFKTLKRLEVPLKAGDSCILYANSKYYSVFAVER